MGWAKSTAHVLLSTLREYGVTGMFRRITDESFLRAGKLVTEAARRVSHALGYRT